ncbi:MAG: hypothetical protein IAF08_09990 [Rhizobacter sp.]|nr:hypothetical protein [Chlorobiales bacterium]
MRKFGELLLEEGHATKDQVERALTYQTLGESLLGRILTDMKFISLDDKLRILAYQQLHRTKKFGECAVELSLITESQFQKAFEFQRKPKGAIGELMVELGFITHDQRERVLQRQQA